MDVIGEAVVSCAVDRAIGNMWKKFRELSLRHELALDYRAFLLTVFEKDDLDYSALVDVLNKAERYPSSAALVEAVTKEVSFLTDDKESVPSVVDFILAFVAARNPGAKVLLENHPDNIDKSNADVERRKFLLDIYELFRKAVADSDVFPLEWFDENLISSSCGKLSLSFFDGFDAMFEGKLAELVRKGEYNTLEIHTSDDRMTAFYYVLFVLKKCGFSNMVKVIRRREVWESRLDCSPGDILVAVFGDYRDFIPHGSCINIKIHDRGESPDGESPNYLKLRRASGYLLRQRLDELYDKNSRIVDSLLEKTSGNFSLLEAEITKHQVVHSWDNVRAGSVEFGVLVDLLVIPHFSSLDFAALENAGINPGLVVDVAERINSEVGCPLFFVSSRNGLDTYSLVSPDRLWCFCAGRDRRFSSKFIERALPLLLDGNVSSRIINGILFSFIRHSRDFLGVITGEDFFEKVAPAILKRSDRDEILCALTELSPLRMLEWLEKNPHEVNDTSFNALALLMHDCRYSKKCISLILDNCSEDGGETYNSARELVKEFFRAFFDTSGVQADEVCTILKSARNTEAMKKTVFDVLFREHSAFTLVSVFYRYRVSYAEEQRERTKEDFRKIEEYEMRWYLSHSDAEGLVSFVSSVDFIYFDVFDSLRKAVCRIRGKASGREAAGLYAALFNLYYRWFFSSRPFKEKIIEGLKPCLEAASPGMSELRIVPYLMLDCPILMYSSSTGGERKRVERNEFCREIASVVRKEEVPFEKYMNLVSLIDEDDINWEDYVKVIFEIYPEEAFKGSTFSRLPEDGERYYVGELCRRFPEHIDEVFASFDEEASFRFIYHAPYSSVTDKLSLLPYSLRDRYWSERLNFNPGNPDKEQKKHIIDELISHGSGYPVFLLLDVWSDDFTEDELCSIVPRLIGLGKVRNSSRHLKGIFRRLRLYSDSGSLPFDTVLEWEEKLLSDEELLEKDSFFMHSFLSSPRIMCSLMHDLFKNDDGESRELDEEMRKEKYKLFFSINACPGTDRGFNVDYGVLSSWVDSFIRCMRAQKQTDIIPVGLGKVLSFSVKHFVDRLHSAVCRVLENLPYDVKDGTLSHLASEIGNRQGAYYEDGRVMADSSLRFRTYSEELKAQGFKAASLVYSYLSSSYEMWDNLGRDE